MNKSDTIGMLASSLAGVIRQSLDATFRKECFLLLGVTNNMEAHDTIYGLLKSRDLKKTGNLTSLSSSQALPLEESDPLPEKLESPALTNIQKENSTPELERFIGCLSETSRSRESEPAHLQITKAMELNAEKASEVEDISDDETQLDWDTDVLTM